ncbi:juvenile hormone esterase-like [Anopheles nili]|uniref:juvenile hormone esterase-like n=1 Tax=Anopheles nili TaxID=185578 RepID=UPI00237B3BC5|nr:juvenile hormone esterase-like [Anopheles nili]
MVPLVLTGSTFHPDAPRVCIEDGCMRGSWMRSFLGNRYQAFVGVPFAKPPVGPLRFANPVPNEPWTEQELDVSSSVGRELCLHQNIFFMERGIEGSEDCLYLNVYTPRKTDGKENNSSSSPMATLMYIHGGIYMFGYSSPFVLGAENLMDYPVILVTIMYRVGAFGFLSTGDEAASGNFGLKDQQLAMRWIQKNIHAFGGDPKLVTIIGNSSGGSSVHLHLMHLQNEGLFQRAISLSGNALALWSTPKKNPEQTARRQAALVGIENSEQLTTSELVQALRSVDANQIVESYLQLANGSRHHMTIYGPVVEATTVENAFLTAQPRDLWAQGKYLSVPWLTGIVPNEGFLSSFFTRINTDCTKKALSDQRQLIVSLLGGNGTFDNLLKERFLGNQTTTDECFTKQNIDVLTKIFSEVLFFYPLFLSVRQHTEHKHQKAPIFLYKFNYKGKYSFSSMFDTDKSVAHDYGVVHPDEMIYIFRMLMLFPIPRRNSPDAKASQRFIELLVNFARTGIAPNGKDVGHLEASSHDLDTNDAEFPLAFELINTNRTDEPVAQRFVDIYDEEMFNFWKSFFGD